MNSRFRHHLRWIGGVLSVSFLFLAFTGSRAVREPTCERCLDLRPSCDRGLADFPLQQACNRCAKLWPRCAAANAEPGFCGDNSPARPAPECRNASGTAVACSTPGAVRLWPDNLRPGNPDQQLPANRDSTHWNGFTLPGGNGSDELWHNLAVAEDQLFTVYNVGLQVWDLVGSCAERPCHRRTADGWLGGWLHFPTPGKFDFYVQDVDAVRQGDDWLIAVAALEGVGPSIWRYTRALNRLEQLYQDLDGGSVDVSIVRIGNRWLGYYSGYQIRDVTIYDLSAADQCATCGSVRLGDLGSSNANTVATLALTDDQALVAVGRDAIDAELWRVDSTGFGQRTWSGLVGGVQGIELFEVGPRVYLAAVHRQMPGLDWRVVVLDATSCQTGSCSNLPEVWSRDVTDSGQDRFLAVSSGLLHFGVHSSGLEGAGVEGLWDVSCIDSGAVTPVLSGGGTYTDSCHGLEVDYWGDYYSRNDHGLRHFRPRTMRCPGTGYCYRVAFSVLDVHRLVYEPPACSDLIFEDAFESGDLAAW